MTYSQKNHRTILINKIIIVAVVLVLAYFVFSVRGLFKSRIIIDNIKDYQEIKGSSLTFSGRIKSATMIQINDHETTIIGNGYFSEYLILQPGYNTIYVGGTDRFKRTYKKEIHLFSVL